MLSIKEERMPLTKPNKSTLPGPDVLTSFLSPDFPITFSTKKIGWDGWTPMHDAISKQNEAVVDSLLPTMSAGGTDQGWAAAHVATQVGNAPIAKKVLAAKPHCGNKVGWNPFHMSVLSGNTEIIDKAAELSMFAPAYGNKFGFHALHVAAYTGNVDTMIHIFTKLPELKERGNEHGWDSAHIACAAGKTDALQYLLSNGVLAGSGDANGWWRPSHVAAYYNHLDCLKLLAGKWDGNMEETKPVHVAIMQDKGGDHRGIVEYCTKELGQSIHTSDKNGATPLNLAVYDKHTEILRFFLDNDPNGQALARDILVSPEVPQESMDVAMAFLGEFLEVA